MAKHMTRALIAIVALCFMHTAAAANIVLDLDLKEGDQGVREEQVKPGDTRQIEVIALRGAQDIEGVEFVLRFDTQKVTFKDFQKGGIMANAIQLPIKTTAEGVKISLGFLGQKSTQDAGRLGILSVELSSNLDQGARVELIKGSYGAKGQITEFDLSEGVKLINASAPKQPGPPSGHQPPGQPPHQPPGFQPPGQPPGFQPPGQPPHHPGPGGPPMERGPDPEAMIRQLPEALQGTFRETLKFTEKAHLQAELQSQERILKTLQETRRFAASAPPEQKQAIAEVIHFFHMPPPPGFDPMPPGGVGHGPQGGAPAPPHQAPQDLNQMIDQAMREIRQHIRELKRDLSTM